MKYTKLSLLLVLVLASFYMGYFFAERASIETRIRSAQHEIAVTEVLLNLYLNQCNQSGYLQFATFHEHNLDNVYKMMDYYRAFPYLLSEAFSNEMQSLYDPYKNQFVQVKSDFIQKCGDMQK